MCQETSPDSSEGPIPSSPARLSPLPSNPLEPLDLDLESQPPIIHDIVTSSPGDNEHLGAMPFVTNMDLGSQLDIQAAEILPLEPEESCSAPPTTETPASAEHALDAAADVGSSHAFGAAPEDDIPAETLTAADVPSRVEADISFVPDTTEPLSRAPERLVTEHLSDETPAPEIVGPAEEEEEATKPSETPAEDEGEEEEEEEEGMDLSCRKSFCFLH